MANVCAAPKIRIARRLVRYVMQTIKSATQRKLGRSANLAQKTAIARLIMSVRIKIRASAVRRKSVSRSVRQTPNVRASRRRRKQRAVIGATTKVRLPCVVPVGRMVHVRGCGRAIGFVVQTCLVGRHRLLVDSPRPANLDAIRTIAAVWWAAQMMGIARRAICVMPTSVQRSVMPTLIAMG